MAGEGIWDVIRQQVENVIASEPVMESFLKKVVLDRQSLSDSVAYNLATKFGNEHIPHDKIHTIISNAYNADEAIIAAIEEDIMAVYDRDPACTSYFAPLLFFKGFLSLSEHGLCKECFELGWWVVVLIRSTIRLFTNQALQC